MAWVTFYVPALQLFKIKWTQSNNKHTKKVV